MEFQYGHKGRLLVELHPYQDNGRVAVELVGPDQAVEELFGQYARLSINVPEIRLEYDEFIVPVRDLSLDLIDAALASGLFVDTGKRVDYGFVQGDPVWALTEDAKKQWLKERS